MNSWILICTGLQQKTIDGFIDALERISNIATSACGLWLYVRSE